MQEPMSMAFVNIKRNFDFSGSHGEFWRQKLPTPEILQKHPDWAAKLASWLLHVPDAHPFWHSYSMNLIHLRPVENGTRLPTKKYPEAEFEVFLVALDPRHPLPNPDAGDGKDVYTLSPPNLVEQFHGMADDRAIAMVEMLAVAFVTGVTSPDTDFISRTQDLFRNTIEHEILGGHPDKRNPA